MTFLLCIRELRSRMKTTRKQVAEQKSWLKVSRNIDKEKLMTENCNDAAFCKFAFNEVFSKFAEACI